MENIGIPTLIIGALEIIAGATTIYKIKKGSQVPFAFTMTTFTCLYGLSFISTALFLMYYDIMSKTYLIYRTVYYWLSV